MNDNHQIETSENQGNAPPPTPEAPKTKEEIAMEKVVDIKAREFDLLNHETELGNLAKILKEGVLPMDHLDTWWSQGFLPRHGPKGEVRENEFIRLSLLANKPKTAIEANSLGLTWYRVPEGIAPQEITGLLLPDWLIVNYREAWEKGGKEAKDFAVKEASRIAEENFTLENALPIYGTSGDLLWPQQIPADQLRTTPKA